MVTINPKEVIIGKDGITPVMRQHTLKCVQTTGTFFDGKTTKCFVAEFTDGRFAVWDASHLHHNKYEVFTEQDLHACFEEL